MKKLKGTLITVITILIIVGFIVPGSLFAQSGDTKNDYVSVNGLEIYYEIHGTGQDGVPLVLLHGAFGNLSGPMDTLAVNLSDSRKIISFAMQGHGRTADIDRPLSVEQMAEDVAGALTKLGYDRIDVFGYSMGGGIALQLTVKYPNLVRKMINVSAAFSHKGNYPGMAKMMQNLSPKMFEGTPIRKAYNRLAPNPDHFPVLVEKIKKMGTSNPNWNYKQEIKSINAPTLLIFGDADIVRPEHAVKFFRLLGGGRLPNLMAIPHTQLAILPGTTHIGVFMHQLDLIIPMVDRFLEQPMPDENNK